MNTLEITLENAPKSDLVAFLLDTATQDETFRNELLVALGAPDIDAELKDVKARIQTSIRRHTRSGFIDYGDCIGVCRDFNELSAQGERRVQQGHPVLAYKIGLAVYAKAYWLVSHGGDSSGCGTETITAALALLDHASASAITEEDKKVIFEAGCKEAQNKVFHGWGNANYNLIATVVRHITSKNKKKMFDSLDKLDTAELKEDGSCWYGDQYSRLVRLEIVRELEGEAAYDAALTEHLGIDKVRKIAIRRAIKKGDFPLAERLCREKIAALADRVRLQRDWNDLLLEIYETTNPAAALELAESALLRAPSESGYDRLKQLWGERWSVEFPRLRPLFAEHFPTEAYLYVLDIEGENEILFAAVQENPKFVLDYGVKLSLYYPDEIVALFLQVLREKAARGGGTKDWKKLCKGIDALYQSGGQDEAFALIGELRGAYPRRGTLQNELENFEKKLRKKQEKDRRER